MHTGIYLERPYDFPVMTHIFQRDTKRERNGKPWIRVWLQLAMSVPRYRAPLQACYVVVSVTNVDHPYAIIFVIIPLLAHLLNTDSKNTYLQFAREGMFAGCTRRPEAHLLNHSGRTPAHMWTAFICTQMKWSGTQVVSPINHHVAQFYATDTGVDPDTVEDFSASN
jgi:hypothetical protein